MEQSSAYNKIIKYFYSLVESKNNKLKEINSIIEVFKNFYGEDYVDAVNSDYDILTEIDHCLSSLQLSYVADPDIKLIDIENIRQRKYTLLDFLNSDYPNFLKLKMVRLRLYAIKNKLKEKLPSTTKIIIHIPEKKVVNENNESTLIHDVYVKLIINQNWKGNLYLSSYSIARSTYSKNEIIKGYIHSHLPKAYNKEDFTNFKSPCLGSGPINNTINFLSSGIFNSDIWNLFALELDLYLGTESLAGGPYMYLRSLKQGNKKYIFNNYYPSDIKVTKSVKEVVTTVLPEILNRDNLIGFDGYSYFLTESIEDFIININEAITKKFSEEYIEKFIHKNYISECKLNDKGELIVIERNSSNLIDIDELESLHLTENFKGKKIPIKVIKSENDNTEVKTYKIIGHPGIYIYLYKSIINAINIKNSNHE